MIFFKKKELNTINFLLSLWNSLRKKRKIQLLMLLFIMFASAFSEVLSLASLVPFLKIISNPEEVLNTNFFGSILTFFGITDKSNIIIFSSFIFSSVVICTALIRLLNIYLNGKLSACIGGDLSYEAYKRSIYQSYSYHFSNNSNESINTITGQINITISVVNRTLQFFTSSIVASSIFIALVIFNAKIAISTGFIFLFSYLLIILNVREKLLKNTTTFVKASQEQLKAIQEGFGAIRDILLDSNQKVYLDKFKSYDQPMRHSVANSLFLESFPRYTLEAIGICSISFIALTIINQENYDNSDFFATLGTIALGAQRLLPALQQTYASWASIKGNSASVKKVIEIINLDLSPEFHSQSKENFNFNYSISFINTSYSYKDKNNFSLKNINCLIKKGEKIGIVGSTGSGKSTFVNLLMGLLKPAEGDILIDGKNLYSYYKNCISSWRANISHVPQSIFLSDLSLAENIAFGVPKEKIDFRKVHLVSKMAQISSFIDSLPNGYQTYVGENGVRLSGGQRQRLGIARALYKEKQILILDEATSALDEKTEKKVMEQIYKLNKEITVIMIAHRLSTLSNCQRIIEFSDGKII